MIPVVTEIAESHDRTGATGESANLVPGILANLVW